MPGGIQIASCNCDNVFASDTSPERTQEDNAIASDRKIDANNTADSGDDAMEVDSSSNGVSGGATGATAAATEDDSEASFVEAEAKYKAADKKALAIACVGAVFDGALEDGCELVKLPRARHIKLRSGLSMNRCPSRPGKECEDCHGSWLRSYLGDGQ